MAIIFKVGSASTASRGSSSPGDQGQSGTPDKSGEVYIKEYDLASFNNYYKGWHISRPYSPERAHELAQWMIVACNNPHIGYGTTTLGKNLETTTNCNADCTGLLSRVVQVVYNCDFWSGSDNFWNNILSVKDGGKQAFQKSFLFDSFETTPVYNGDIISLRGNDAHGKYHHHGEMLVGGNPRNGQPEELLDVVKASTHGSITPIGQWQKGWGLTSFSVFGKNGTSDGRGYGVANKDVNCKGHPYQDDKGYITVAAGSSFDFNTRLEIKELPGIVFQVDDRGDPKEDYEGEKHLGIMVQNPSGHVKVKTTATDSKGNKKTNQVDLGDFIEKHLWPDNCDLHIREVTGPNQEPKPGSGSTGSGSGGGGDSSYGYGNGSGYIELEIQQDFFPRNTKIKEKDEAYKKYYQPAYKEEYGKGYNGSYSWARFSEVQGGEATLSKGYPRKWFTHKEDQYARGATPAIGSIMCFTHMTDKSDPGFVCNVEVVHPNYTYVSYCDNEKNEFHYVRMSQKGGTWNLDLDGDGKNEYLFQGFIYNPSVDGTQSDTSVLQRFVDIAKEQDGQSGKWTEKMTGFKVSTGGWSAAFINAVAKQAGDILGVVIPDTQSCSSIGRIGVEQDLGTWFNGPVYRGKPCPQIGDIMLLRTTRKQRSDVYACDRAGIVVSVKMAMTNSNSKGSGAQSRRYTVEVIEGDVEGRVACKEYGTDSGQFSGLFRPYWNRVDGVAEFSRYIESPIGMYNEGTTIDDAAVRDIAYAAKGDKGFEPSIKKTGITLSAINYTGMLANMYSVLAGLRVSADDDENIVPNIWSYTELAELDFDIFATEPHPATNSWPPGTVLTGSGYYAKDDQNEEDDKNGNPSQDTEWDIKDLDDVVISKDGKSAQVVNVAGGAETMRISSTSRTIFNYLYKATNNKAAVCGIMAHMWGESRWGVGSGPNSAGAIGLTQTIPPSADKLREWCKTHGNNKPWNQNLEGQLSYWLQRRVPEGTDWDTKYNHQGWVKLLKVPDTVEGAGEAAYIVFMWFGIGVGQKQDIENGTNKYLSASLKATYLKQANWRKGTVAPTIWKLFVGGK